MQGRLRNQDLTVTVRTECAHCGMPMELTIDSDLAYAVGDTNSQPLVFIPDVDLLNLEDKNIINAF